MRNAYKSGRRGSTLLWTTTMLAVVMMVLSLAVDYGLRTLAASELQTMADASAIAGAQVLAESGTIDLASIRQSAIAVANSNPATAGTPSLQSSDVEVGYWSDATRTFSMAGTSEANAVRITARRTNARGNAVPGILARVLGVESIDVQRSAIARCERVPDYSLIGLEGFASRGVLTVDGAPFTGKGHIASNGDVKLNLLGLIGVSLIDGHISTLGSVQAPLIGLLTIVSEGIRRPDEPFVLPAVSTAAAQVRNDNANINSLISGSGDMNIAVATSLPAGTYYCRNLNVLAGVIVHLQGPVTIFVEEDVNVLGAVLAYNNNAANFKIRVAGPGTVNIAANVALKADLYAPKSDINILAGVIYNGRLIGRRIDILGTSLFYLRPDLPPPELGRSRVVLVK